MHDEKIPEKIDIKTLCRLPKPDHSAALYIDSAALSVISANLQLAPPSTDRSHKAQKSERPTA